MLLNIDCVNKLASVMVHKRRRFRNEQKTTLRVRTTKRNQTVLKKKGMYVINIICYYQCCCYGHSYSNVMRISILLVLLIAFCLGAARRVLVREVALQWATAAAVRPGAVRGPGRGACTAMGHRRRHAIREAWGGHGHGEGEYIYIYIFRYNIYCHA